MIRSIPLGLSGWLVWASVVLAQVPPPILPPATEEKRLLDLQDELQRSTLALRELTHQPADGQDADRLQKQIDILQKQIEVLQKTTQLLAEQLKKQTPT